MKKITLLAMSFFTALVVNAQDTGKDVTGLLTNPDFEAGDNSGWTYSYDGIGAGHAATAAKFGYQGTHFMEAWTPSTGTLFDFDWYQTIEVPNGYYMVTALAHAVKQDQGDNTPVSEGVFVYANDQQVEVKCTKESPDEYNVLVLVIDGKLTIGYCGIYCNVNWVACDDFQVTQCFGTTEDELNTSWIKCEMTKLGEALSELIENPMSAALRDDIYASIEGVEDLATLADAEAAWATLKQQAADATACIAAYENLILKIEEAYEIVDEGEDGDALDVLIDVVYAAEDKCYNELLDAAGAEAESEALNQAIFDYESSLMNGYENFDVTEMYVTSPSWRQNGVKTGWDVEVIRKMNWGSFPAWGTDLAEIYQCDFNISQTLTNIPNGKYKVRVQAFYRGAQQTAELFANNDAVKLMNLNKYSTSDFGVFGGNYTVQGLVNDLISASAVFNTYNPETDRNFYDENELEVIVMDGNLTFGIRSTTSEMDTWCAFRDFKLFYYGNFPYINLLSKVETIREYLEVNEEKVPAAIFWELDEYMYDIEDEGYTEEGMYSDDEVNAVILELDAKWNVAQEAIALFAELKEQVAYVESELIPLAFPGLDDLWKLVDEAEDYFDPECEDNTYEILLDMKARLDEGIISYYTSQEASPEQPADYTFFVPNPNFEQIGEWMVSMTARSYDLWIGSCRPEAEGGASRRGINLWGGGITSVDVHQALNGLPNGLYKVSAELITQPGYATDQHVYATGAATAVSDPLTIEGWETYEWETLTTNDYAVVVDGTLTIGAAASQGGANSEGWFQATNLKLYYHGKAEFVLTYVIDGVVVDELPVLYGSEVVLPENPTKEGHTFSGWSEAPATMPAEDVTIYGTFSNLLIETITIDDSDNSFSMAENTAYGKICYDRTFNNSDWQALYIPFEIAYEDICEDFEIADINNVHQYDHNDDGMTDETIIEAFKVTSGTLEANYPYLIRAKEAGEKTIIVTDATLYATEENSIDCSSVREKFTFTGTYSKLTSNELSQGEGYYTLVNGMWQPVTEDITLGAFRFYLKVDSRSGASAAEARSIRMRIVGENGDDETTGISNSEIRNHNSEIIYDLQGRRVENPTKGIYIVNGKKVVIK